MITKSVLIGAAMVAALAAVPAPAEAGSSRVDVELGRGGLVVRAGWGDRHDHHDHDHDRDRDRGRDRVRRGHVHRHGHDCHWVPARYEVRPEQVWVPATCRDEYVPPVYHTRIDHCGRVVKVLVRAGYTRRIEIPGHYEVRTVRVLVPGHWSCC